MNVDKNLKRMSREDLLEMLIAQNREIKRLKAELDEKEKALDESKAMIARAENKAREKEEIAEKAYNVSKPDILYHESYDALNAARRYIDYLKQCGERQQDVYNKVIIEAQKKAAAIIADAKAERSRYLQDVIALKKVLDERQSGLPDFDSIINSADFK